MQYENLLILMVFVWTIGKVFRAIKWPAIFGELLAGLIAGPFLLGVVHDSEAIRVLADLGIFFLMLHSGLETDPKELLKASKRSFLIAIGGAFLPFGMGYFASTAFGYDLQQSLFIGMGLSVTAIAVTSKLFKDCNITNTKTAHVTLGAAIIDDIIALILFSIILDIAKTGTVDLMHVAMLSGKIILFFGTVIILGKKFFNHIHKIIYTGNKGFTFTLIIALAFGLFAELIGLHIIIGAFLAGLFIREEVVEPHLFKKIEDRIYGFSHSFLGPIFFATLSFHLDFTAITKNPLFVVVIVLIAIIGKVFGAGIMAYWSKMKPYESLGVGLAMNSRGAVEMIIASIGLQEGIINKEIFSLLVIMAFATTIVSIIGFKPLAKKLRKA